MIQITTCDSYLLCNKNVILITIPTLQLRYTIRLHLIWKFFCYETFIWFWTKVINHFNHEMTIWITFQNEYVNMYCKTSNFIKYIRPCLGIMFGRKFYKILQFINSHFIPYVIPKNVHNDFILIIFLVNFPVVLFAFSTNNRWILNKIF